MTQLLDHLVARQALTDEWIATWGPMGPSKRYTLMESDQVDLSSEMPPPSELPADRLSFKVEAEASAPTWAHNVAAQFNELVQLPAGWNGTLSQPLRLEVVKAALDALNAVMQEDTLVPAVLPGNDGSVQLEWHRAGVHLEVLVLPSGDLDVAYEDQRDPSRNWDDIVSGDLSLLREMLVDLTQREPVSA